MSDENLSSNGNPATRKHTNGPRLIICAVALIVIVLAAIIPRPHSHGTLFFWSNVGWLATQPHGVEIITFVGSVALTICLACIAWDALFAEHDHRDQLS